MISTFKTNPGRVRIGGNIIGTELGTLTNLTGFQNTKCSVSSDGTLAVNGITFNVIKMAYVP